MKALVSCLVQFFFMLVFDESAGLQELSCDSSAGQKSYFVPDSPEQQF
jgi:hypothetical protein